MVIHSEVFERFTQGNTIPLMSQAVMENPRSPRVIDPRFEDVDERQSTREILFSSIVELMSLVVCGIRPSINAAAGRDLGGLRAAAEGHQRRGRGPLAAAGDGGPG